MSKVAGAFLLNLLRPPGRLRLRLLDARTAPGQWKGKGGAYPAPSDGPALRLLKAGRVSEGRKSPNSSSEGWVGVGLSCRPRNLGCEPEAISGAVRGQGNH